MLIDETGQNAVPAVKENKDTSEAQGIVKQNARCEREACSQVCISGISATPRT